MRLCTVFLLRTLSFLNFRAACLNIRAGARSQDWSQVTSRSLAHGAYARKIRRTKTGSRSRDDDDDELVINAARQGATAGLQT